MASYVQVSKGSGNGLLSDDTNPLPKPVFNLPSKMFCGIHLGAASQELEDYTFHISTASPINQYVNV